MKKVIPLLSLIIALCGIAPAQTPGSRPYPATSLDTPATLFDVRDKATAKLASSISAVATTVTVDSTILFPPTGSLVLNNQEIVFYTGKTLTTFTGVIRGREGTAALALAKGVKVEQAQIAAHHNTLALQLIEAQKKIGVGASVATTDFVLVGTGVGASSWMGLPLDKLSDVIITSPSTNDVLKYNGTNWVNGTVAGAGTVTSVAASASGIFGWTGSPITGAELWG